ncbi:MAG: hypothetical protein FD126_3696 [Elusimicrobia bacterium]|nr:MAG: hypothetical protein FD126_3696 [Elusimicrobiota bacterium]
MKGITALIGALSLAISLSACNPPKYVRYTSPFVDFTCDVPWGWSVFLDSAGSDYTNVTFTGPLDPDFFRGVPSLSVRWYGHNAPHRLPDGGLEMYSSAEDFRDQMLRDVYGPGSLEGAPYTKAGSDSDQAKAAAKELALADFDRVSVSGWGATYFVVYRTIEAPEGKVLTRSSIRPRARASTSTAPPSSNSSTASRP